MRKISLESNTLVIVFTIASARRVANQNESAQWQKKTTKNRSKSCDSFTSKAEQKYTLT